MHKTQIKESNKENEKNKLERNEKTAERKGERKKVEGRKMQQTNLELFSCSSFL